MKVNCSQISRLRNKSWNETFRRGRKNLIRYSFSFKTTTFGRIFLCAIYAVSVQSVSVSFSLFSHNPFLKCHLPNRKQKARLFRTWLETKSQIGWSSLGREKSSGKHVLVKTAHILSIIDYLLTKFRTRIWRISGYPVWCKLWHEFVPTRQIY